MEQFNAVIAELGPKYSPLVKAGLLGAIRPSELLALRWRDFAISTHLPHDGITGRASWEKHFSPNSELNGNARRSR